MYSEYGCIACAVIYGRLTERIFAEFSNRRVAYADFASGATSSTSPGWLRPTASSTRSWGGSVEFAYALQAVFTVVAIAVTLWLARKARPDVRNAAVTAAVLISTPYVLDYDFVVLLTGVAFLWRDAARNGWLPWEKSALALIWVAPLFARNLAAITLIPLGLLTTILMLVLAARRGLTPSPSRH